MSDSQTELREVSKLLAEKLHMSTEFEQTASEVADALLNQVNGHTEDAANNGFNYLIGRLPICGLCHELSVMLEIEYEARGI